VVDVRFVDVTSPEPPEVTEEIYPKVPKPLTVEIRDDSNKDVLTSPAADERYPTVPSPLTVLVNELVSPKLLIKLTVPKPTTVDASSVGSIKEEIRV
jgi:hypothetical protein